MLPPALCSALRLPSTGVGANSLPLWLCCEVLPHRLSQVPAVGVRIPTLQPKMCPLWAFAGTLRDPQCSVCLIWPFEVGMVGNLPLCWLAPLLLLSPSCTLAVFGFLWGLPTAQPCSPGLHKICSWKRPSCILPGPVGPTSAQHLRAGGGRGQTVRDSHSSSSSGPRLAVLPGGPGLSPSQQLCWPSLNTQQQLASHQLLSSRISHHPSLGDKKHLLKGLHQPAPGSHEPILQAAVSSY